MANYDHIYYRDHPHFTVGRADQWGEQGYLLYEDKVYFYEEDRKEQCGTTCSPMVVADFLIHAKQYHIAVPPDFMALMLEDRHNCEASKKEG